jgi:hypothetical protein
MATSRDAADYRQLSQDYDIILSDSALPQFDALGALGILQQWIRHPAHRGDRLG